MSRRHRFLLKVDRGELATILAALRFHQDENLQGGGEITDRVIADIATDGGTLKPLDARGIDSLCQRLNLESEPAGHLRGHQGGAMRQNTREPKKKDDYHGTLSPRKIWKYVNSEGACCPFCHGKRIEGTGNRNMDGNWCDNEVECLDCGAEWKDVYFLGDVQVTKEPDRR